MNNILQTPDLLLDNFRQLITQNSILLLAKYQILPQLVCEGIIDRIIADIECTGEETNTACQQFYQQWNLTTDKHQQIRRTVVCRSGAAIL